MLDGAWGCRGSLGGCEGVDGMDEIACKRGVGEFGSIVLIVAAEKW